MSPFVSYRGSTHSDRLSSSKLLFNRSNNRHSLFDSVRQNLGLTHAPHFWIKLILFQNFQLFESNLDWQWHIDDSVCYSVLPCLLVLKTRVSLQSYPRQKFETQMIHTPRRDSTSPKQALIRWLLQVNSVNPQYSQGDFLLFTPSDFCCSFNVFSLYSLLSKSPKLYLHPPRRQSAQNLLRPYGQPRSKQSNHRWNQQNSF